LTEIDVGPVQEDIVAIRSTLEVGLNVIDHIEHGQVGGACFELKLRVFNGEEELKIAEILSAGRMSGDM
jgi:hypothetical protein